MIEVRCKQEVHSWYGGQTGKQRLESSEDRWLRSGPGRDEALHRAPQVGRGAGPVKCCEGLTPTG